MSTFTSRNAKKIADQHGTQKTLARGLFSFLYLNPLNFNPYSTKNEQLEKKPKKILFLGLGYNAADDTLNILSDNEEIYVYEYPLFTQACEEGNVEVSHIEKAQYLTENELLIFLQNQENLSELAIYIYKQNLSLFPSYWNRLLLKIEDLLVSSMQNYLDISKKYSNNTNSSARKKVFFASFENDLMHREVQDALEECGYTCLKHQARTSTANPLSILQINELSYYNIKETIQLEKPDFFISINGRFLDSNGRTFALLEHLKIPLALWIVDNVWNILSAFKSDWWKECHIFVSDSSFIPQLRELGAKYVYYLPLAGSQTTHVSEKLAKSIDNIELLFIGHSAFTDKSSFFNAVDKTSNFIESKKSEILTSYISKKSIANINFHTIYNELKQYENIRLWGSHDFRKISYFASELDLFNKVFWLDKLSKNLTIIGDKGWNDLLNKPKLLPPIDYYTTLPSYYNRANFTLNIPSMLMPNALTQRHFDVWLSDGFLFSAPTKGLEIFSNEHQESITVATPDELQMKMKVLSLNTSHYNNLKKYIKNEIISSHLYKHRVETMIKVCF